MKPTLQVKDVMTTNVVTIETHQTVGEAVRLMTQRWVGGKGVGSLLVVKRGFAVGILTERDFIEKVLAKKLNPEKIRVEEIMSKPIITCTPNTTLQQAAEFMLKHKIRHLPVLDREKLVGIVALFDVIPHLVIPTT